MDNITKIKHLIALLQALVAILIGQLAALPPQQVATTTPLGVPPLVIATSTPSVAPQPFLSVEVVQPATSTKVGWDEGSLPFGVNGIVSTQSVIVGSSSIYFQFIARRGLYTGATIILTSDSGAYEAPMDISSIGAGTAGVAQKTVQYAELPSKGSWHWHAQIVAGNLYAEQEGDFTIQ